MRLKVKEILEKQDKTAYWLSKQTGISANNIGKICNGETTNIRFDTMEKICKALNCTPNDLVEFDDPKLKHLITYATLLSNTKDIKDDEK